MSDEVDHMEDVGPGTADFFEHEPSKNDRIEMRKAVKPPSEWLKLLCKQWSEENQFLVDSTDAKFMDYKPYLKGLLTSQLLCRLSVPTNKEVGLDVSPPFVDFWRILGIEDDFDKAYIISQVERFCSYYNIRGVPLDEDPLFSGDYGAALSPGDGMSLSTYMDHQDAACAEISKLPKKDSSNEMNKAHRMAKDAMKALDVERKHTIKREQKRVAQERKEQKAREREASAVRKAEERTAREATREERKRKKEEIREEREQRAREQKQAALRRAAELVSSNRVPIEITRGAAAAKAAANAALAAAGGPLSENSEDDSCQVESRKKRRSAIVVSTAGDLHTICTHAKALFAKYNAIAREHNQKVGWATVAKELGIHVKVREKYSRMHARAETRGFDWIKCSHYKLKNHPNIFLEPTSEEKKAKMPRSVSANAEATMWIEPKKYIPQGASDNAVLSAQDTADEMSVTMNDEAVAAAAAAAAVVDASVTSPTVTEEQVAAADAVVAATMQPPDDLGIANDPTSPLVDHSIDV